MIPSHIQTSNEREREYICLNIMVDITLYLINVFIMINMHYD